MSLINEGIEHSQFGEGKVINQEADRISILFSEKYGTKQFIYPDAFEKYLKLDNSEKETSVLAELNDKKAQIENEKIRKQQEHETDLKDKALEKATNAANKKKATAKKAAPKAKKVKELELEG